MVDVPVRIGTRKSLLARTQTTGFADEFERHNPGTTTTQVFIRTTGDAVTDRALSAVGGKGLFTKEIEDALLRGEIDCAVHSLKDLPTELPHGLALGAIPVREDPRDALVGMTVEQLRQAESTSTVGTSSLRRAAQIRRAFPAATVVDLRGNVDTRLRKVHDGEIDCAVLAFAGLLRVGKAEEADTILGPELMLPAPAQGALGIEIRADDERMKRLLEPLCCVEAEQRVTAERIVLATLGGGCHVPVAAYAWREGDVLHLTARVISLDGQQMVEAKSSERFGAASQLGHRVSDELLNMGADRIIQSLLKEGDEHRG